MKEINLNVSGMVCNGCENRIKNALSNIAGVESVVASHESGMVNITVNENVEENVIKEAIENLGFEIMKED